MMNDRYNADALQKLTDEFIKFKRYVEDALENQQTGLNSSSVKKLIAEYGSTSSAGFDAYADAKKAIAEMFAKFEAEASSTIAEIKVMAENNKAEISLLSSTVSANGASIASIQTRADASGAFINLLAYSGNKNIDTSKGYYYDGSNDEYVFYDSESKPVRLSSYEFAGIYIEAMNKGTTSELTSVRLNADVIKFGDYASVDDKGSLRIKRLYHYGGNQFYAQVGNDTGSFADFGVYDEANGYWAWRFFNNDMTAKVIHLKIYEDDIFGYNGLQKKTYPKGEWDFSSCSVSNIPLYFS